MKILFRYSLRVRSEQFPYIAPMEIEQIAENLYQKCKRYSIGDIGRLVLIPIETPEYHMILEFKERYSEYTSKLISYEHRFNKKEMDNAEYFLLKSNSLILPKESSTKMFSRCCEKETLIGEQEGYFIINKKDMLNKVITFTSPYKFFVSIEFKEVVEKNTYKNFKFIPVYSPSMNEILAYQMEAVKLLPPIDDYNHWGIYKECSNCKKSIHNSYNKNPNPIAIPMLMKDSLMDINSTLEVFSEIQAHNYIISRRVYELMLSMGAKKLACEPIMFI